MTKNQVRVSPKKDGGWRVHKSWSVKDSIHTQTKDEAVTKAREIARNQKTELIVQKKDGKIAQKDSYGRDPFPPKG